MAAKVYFSPFIPAFSSKGAPVPGAYLYFFYTGTNNLAPVYSTAAMTTPLGNPVRAGLDGKYPDIYLSDAITYRVRQTDSNRSPLGNDIDPYIPGVLASGPAGATGGNVMSIGTFSEAPTKTVPTGADLVRTSGYSTTGVGVSDYYYDASVNSGFVTSNPRTSFLSSNGRGFRLLQEGRADVRKFGAVGALGLDDTAAFKAAAAFSTLTGVPFYIPSGNFPVSDEIVIKEGVYGEGPTSVVTVIKSNRSSWSSGGSAVNGRKAVFVISPTGSAPRSVVCRDFKIVGAGDRPTSRSPDESSMNFYGTGVLFTDNAFGVHVTGVEIGFCFKGIDFNTYNGHFGATGCNVNNCWYGLYFEKNTGDYRFVDCVFTGNQFASIGIKGSNPNNGTADFGGLTGITMIGCHLGFGPYGMFQEDGNGTIGINSMVLINCGFEQIGNCAIRLGGRTNNQRRVSNRWFFYDCGCSNISDGSAEAANFRINGNSSHPINVYAVNEIDLLQGGPLVTEGSGLLQGSSGYVFNINTALDRCQDFRGAWVFKFNTSGGDFNVGNGFHFTQKKQINSNVPVSGGIATVTTFDLPSLVDGIPQGEIFFSLDCNNTGGAARAQVRITNNDNASDNGGYRFFTIPAGISTVQFRGKVDVPRRNRTSGVFQLVVKLINVPSGITFNDAGLPTDASIHIDNALPL